MMEPLWKQTDDEAQSPESTSSVPRHWPRLDGLRGVAILMVVGYHTLIFNKATNTLMVFFGSLARSGWMGVPLFFVLSGFLISHLFFEARNQNRQLSAKTFFRNRALKILPPYFLSIMAAGGIALFYHETTGLLGRIIWSATFSFTWVDEPNPLMGIYWTLGVEIWFYVAFFLVYQATSSRPLPSQGLGLSILFIVTASVFKTMVLLFPFLRSYAHPLGWFDYFGWGIAVSTLIHVRAVSNPKIEKWMEPLAAVGFVGLVVLAFGCGFSTLSLSVPDVSIYIRAMQNSLWLSPLLGVCGALILFVNQLPNGSRLAQMMTARWLRWIGLVSYEWYLFHLFFITPGKAGGSLTRLIEYSLGPALISLVFSGLVFHLCSKPIMAMGKGIDH